MTTIVTDTGFGPDTWTTGFAAWDTANDVAALDVPSDADPDALLTRLAGLKMIRIDFPSFADGRGFTLAHRLRLAGYTGRLRAKGHVLADQYAMARRSGFDEVEIDDDLALRQPEHQWRFRANWDSHDHRARLRG
jgi:uncharacterized protein (DUF934 family)